MDLNGQRPLQTVIQIKFKLPLLFFTRETQPYLILSVSGSVSLFLCVSFVSYLLP